MATTRKKDEINSIIESKLDELKNEFINSTKELFIKEMKAEMKKLFAEELEKFSIETNKKLDELQSTSALLQKHVENLKRSNMELQKKCEENEQYGRRLCLRIKGLPKKTKESANDVLQQVRDLFQEAKVEIPEAVLDRAHRISRKNNDVIVRFTTFRHRTLLYRNRKNLENKSIHLDLTKSRLSLLNEARKLTENNENVAFCYADINCRCKLRFIDNEELFFESLEDLKVKLSG